MFVIENDDGKFFNGSCENLCFWAYEQCRIYDTQKQARDQITKIASVYPNLIIRELN